jgi:protein arginine kinase activator
MLCQKCHKNLASVRYAEVVDGRVTEQQLCPTCMATQDTEETGFALTSPGVRMRTATAQDVAAEALRTQRACPTCGTLLRVVLDEGAVGCSGCYTAFGDEIESILEGLHASLIHKGKTLRHDDERAKMRAELQTKRALLRSMLRAENYEEAARLRDTIRDLEATLPVPDAETE